MKAILVAIDTDEDYAEAQAETICELFDPEDVVAHLLHVFTDNSEGVSVHRLPSVDRAREIFENAGIEVVYHEASGVPTENIIKAAAEIEADAVSVAGRKRSPAGKAVFGSVAQSVVLQSDRPVISCKSERRS